MQQQLYSILFYLSGIEYIYIYCHTFNLLEWEVSYLRDFSVIKKLKEYIFDYNRQLWQGLLPAPVPHSPQTSLHCPLTDHDVHKQGPTKGSPGGRIDHELRNPPVKSQLSFLLDLVQDSQFFHPQTARPGSSLKLMMDVLKHREPKKAARWCGSILLTMTLEPREMMFTRGHFTRAKSHSNNGARVPITSWHSYQFHLQFQKFLFTASKYQYTQLFSMPPSQCRSPPKMIGFCVDISSVPILTSKEDRLDGSTQMRPVRSYPIRGHRGWLCFLIPPYPIVLMPQ